MVQLKRILQDGRRLVYNDMKGVGKMNNDWIESDITNSMINDSKEISLEEIAKLVYKYLGMEVNDFNMDRLEELNATIFMPKDNIRGISGVIVGDDKSYLTCGSIYPIEHYIEDFRNGKRDVILEEQNDLSANKIVLIKKAIINNLNEWLKYLNTEQNDPIWKPRNGLFLNRINASLDILKNANDNEIVIQLIELVKNIPDFIEKEDKENLKDIVNKLIDLVN